MQMLSKELFIHQRDPAVEIGPGALTYVSAHANHLLFQYQESRVSDVVDSQQEILSRDNGRTWSAPRPFRVRRPVEGGTECYNDMATFLDPVTDKVCFIIDRYIERASGTLLTDVQPDMVFAEYEHRTDTFRVIESHQFGLKPGIFVSMCWPVFLRRDKVLVPAKTFALDAQGEILRYAPDSRQAVQQDVMVIGDRQASGGWTWRLGGRVPSLPMEVSCRGCHEHSVARLADGRLVTVIRGSNAKFPERPGLKWQSFSRDDGETWTPPEPLRYHDHFLMESGSNGPCLWRSSKTGKLYFIGNPCVAGERAVGNWPRSPLAIFEVREEPFALRRDTMTVIDQRGPGDAARLQLSNFRFYEDREDGNLVLFMTRLGEKGGEPDTQGDLYRYRIELD